MVERIQFRSWGGKKRRGCGGFLGGLVGFGNRFENTG